MTPTRLQMHDMVGPYHIDRACFVVPSPKVIFLQQHMFIIIVTKYVASPSLPGHHCSLHLMWLLILITFLFIITPMLYIFREKNKESYKENFVSKMSKALWEMFAWSSSAFEIGGSREMRRASQQIFSACTMVFILIITWAYRCSSIISK